MHMNNVIFISLLIVFTYSCKTTNNISEKTDFVVFTYRKSECKGKCPAYYMEIFNSGKVTFEGTKNVEKIGKFSKQIEIKEVENLISAFEKAKFNAFKNEYTSLITDLPTTYIGYTNNDTTKTICDYYGAPKELKDLELLLENIVNSDNWIKTE